MVIRPGLLMRKNRDSEKTELLSVDKVIKRLR